MGRLLRAELLKLRTTRTFLALAGTAVGLSLLLTVLVAALTEPTRASVVGDVFESDLSSLFILVLAVVGISGEWRHRTITSSLLAAPDRVGFMAAKTLAYAAAGVVLSLLITVAIDVAGLAILSLRDLPTPGLGDLLDLGWRNLVLAALLGGFGVGVGALVRNQPVAIVGLLAFAFIVEPVLLSLVPEVARFGPLVGLPSGVTQSDLGLDVALLAPGLALLALLAWWARPSASGRSSCAAATSTGDSG
jgi:ABC-2 type transport system permease protein